MITESDEIRCKNSFDLIDASSLEPKTKADLKESIEEAKLNLNGRSLDERCASIARNQFDTSRFIADIIIQFKNVTEDFKEKARQKKTWADVVGESRWAICILGSVIAVCCIFSENIVDLFDKVASLIIR